MSNHTDDQTSDGVLTVFVDKGGRPSVEISPARLYQLGKLHISQAVAAAIEGVSLSSMERCLRRTETVEDEDGKDEQVPGIHRRAWEQGRGERAKRLSDVQWDAALGGNVTMQIFLGKNWLGQSDRQELTGAEGAPLHPSSPVVIAVSPEVAGNIFDELEAMGGIAPGGNGSNGDGVHAASEDVDTEAGRFPSATSP